MLIAYCSDLHLEFRNNWLPIIKNSKKADLLILAGDIVPFCLLYGGEYDTFFEQISKGFKHIIWVPGNHCWYGSLFEEYTITKAQEYITSFAPNIVIVPKMGATYDVEDVTLLCGTAWTNIGVNRVGDALFMDYAKIMVNDHNGLRRLKTTDTTENHLSMREMFENNLSDALGTDKKIVVVSHHLPLEESIDPRYAGDSSNRFFYSDLSHLFKICPDNLKVWIHGHTHTRHNYLYGNTRVLCNPLGYPKEEVSLKFKLQYVTV